MRQFVSLRFWLSIAALIGLTCGLWYVLVSRDDSVAVLGPPARTEAPAHRINLLLPVYGIQAEPGFAMIDGVAGTEMRLALDATRTMVVKPGTPGEITCGQLAQINQCVVAADLLGDAVVWFSLIPNPQRANLVLPGVTEVHDENWLLLANGWEVSRAEVVERNCDAAGLEDFVARFGGNLSTATFSFEQQEITKVTCLEEPESVTTSTTSTTLPPASIAPDAAIVPAETIPADVPAETVPLETTPG